LRQLHDLLNRDGLIFAEPYEYHPHVTLAQDFPKERVVELASIARRRWADFQGPRRYTIDVLAFVQNTTSNIWIDLEDFRLNPVPSYPEIDPATSRR
jgi:hypothetical protein